MRNSLVLACAVGLATLAAPLALADAIPPPQTLSPVQTQMVGTWQQTGQPPMRGHAEMRSTLVFDQDKYTKVQLQIIQPSNASQTITESGTWTGEAAGGGYTLTLTPDGGKPQPFTVTMTGAKTMTMQLWSGSPAVAPFERVFP